MSHPIDALTADNPAVAVRLALEPVRCIDCGQYVPFGWVEYGTVKCADNIGASGVQYGHRVESDIAVHIKDKLHNEVTR